jgi:flagellar protein FliO/FliZ
MFMDMDPLQIILFLLGFGSILFLTYVTTRYIAGRSNRALKGRHIQIVETVSLGLDKRIHLVKAGNQYILISSTSKHVEFLSKVDVEDAENKTPEAPGLQNVFNFKELFDKYASAYRRRNEDRGENAGTTAGEAGAQSFRSNLDRLRTIVHRTDQVGKDGDDVTNEK